ncbi:MAG: hypothetical protein M3N43_10755 [Actinomycetota bacterium]|nr:hypothetical protein [Actinomycetota bacterium]
MTGSSDDEVFTAAQREWLTKLMDIFGESVDERVQWLAQCMLHISDGETALQFQVIALRRLLDRRGIVITDAEIVAEVQELKAHREVEKELGPGAAEYVKVSEMREILRRLLSKKQ